jgi:hypothetical protein
LEQSLRPVETEGTLPRPKPPAAWACRRRGGAWLLAGDETLQGGLDAASAARTAQAYAEAFGGAALVCSIFDDSCARWAYFLPGLRLRAIRLTGRLELRSEERFPEDREFPAFLLPFLPEESEERLRELWERKQAREEERFFRLAELLGAPDWRGPGFQLPEGAELIRSGGRADGSPPAAE